MATNDESDGIDIGNDRSHEAAHDEMQECIEECLNCHAVCTMTLQHCIASGGDHTEVNLVGIILDCAEMCQTSGNFLLGSPYHVNRARRAPASCLRRSGRGIQSTTDGALCGCVRRAES
jgi:hypothetical protein